MRPLPHRFLTVTARAEASREPPGTSNIRTLVSSTLPLGMEFHHESFGVHEYSVPIDFNDGEQVLLYCKDHRALTSRTSSRESKYTESTSAADGGVIPTISQDVRRALCGNQCILVKAAVRILADRKRNRDVEWWAHSAAAA